MASSWLAGLAGGLGGVSQLANSVAAQKIAAEKEAFDRRMAMMQESRLTRGQDLQAENNQLQRDLQAKQFQSMDLARGQTSLGRIIPKIPRTTDVSGSPLLEAAQQYDMGDLFSTTPGTKAQIAPSPMKVGGMTLPGTHVAALGTPSRTYRTPTDDERQTDDDLSRVEAMLSDFPADDPRYNVAKHAKSPAEFNSLLNGLESPKADLNAMYAQAVADDNKPEMARLAAAMRASANARDTSPDVIPATAWNSIYTPNYNRLLASKAKAAGLDPSMVTAYDPKAQAAYKVVVDEAAREASQVTAATLRARFGPAAEPFIGAMMPPAPTRTVLQEIRDAIRAAQEGR